MLIVPAIDLKDGKCVRLRQGRMDESTVFSDDPVAMADHWVAKGARRLHLVDLNGAFEGHPVNGDIITAIAANHPDLPIQLGGGIRSAEIIEAYLKAGVNYVIIGTKAVEQPEFVGEMCKRFPGHVIVGLDGLHGMAATRGWAEVSDISIKSLALLFEADGIEAIVYTDIGKDGMMKGLNLRATRDLANATSIPVIAAGGVTDIKDVQAMLDVAPKVDGGIIGAITGRALYEGTLDLQEAQSLCDEHSKAIE
jgi:phosphoribosylformimino-5-aminoimidazole carboxamide ribotide isomerase